MNSMTSLYMEQGFNDPRTANVSQIICKNFRREVCFFLQKPS